MSNPKIIIQVFLFINVFLVVQSSKPFLNDILKSETSSQTNFTFQSFIDVTQNYEQLIKNGNNPQNFTMSVVTGYLPIGDTNYNTNYSTGNQSQIWYQFFTQTNTNLNTTNQSIPFILWLQGGPGASGWYGNGYELGPYITQKFSNNNTFYLVENQYTWSKQAHILFIDQPYGVGYSLSIGPDSPVPNNTITGSEVIENILNEFFSNPNLTKFKNNPFYIFGESYGGHYIANLAAKILTNNKYKINLKGIGSGDGWVQGFTQGCKYSTYYLSTGTISRMRFYQYKLVEGAEIETMLNNEYVEASYLFNLEQNTLPTYTKIPDIANYKKYKYTDETAILSEWLSQDDTLNMFGVPLNFTNRPNHAFSMGGNQDNVDIYDAYAVDFAASFTNNYTIILENVPVLLYQGQVDGEVPTSTQWNWINNIQWSQMENFRTAQKQNWTLNNNVVGNKKMYQNLWFYMIYQSGHMVPHDQPGPALEMLTEFLAAVNPTSN